MSYRAFRTGWVRGGLGCLIAVPMVLLIGTGVGLLTLDSVAGVLLGSVCLATVMFCVAALMISTRLQFVVDDEGITILTYFRPRRIRWEEIAVIEQSSSY